MNDLNNQWFSGQLPQLTSSYSGIHTNYELSSINGHFTHYEAIPANAADGTLFGRAAADADSQLLTIPRSSATATRIMAIRPR